MATLYDLLRMARPYDWVFATALAGFCIQTGISICFFLRIRRDFRTKPAAYSPPVTVIVPCKGVSEGFRENILSQLKQDYSGDLEFIYVTPTDTDPATAMLNSILESKSESVNMRVLASGQVPTRCSSVNLQILFAQKHAQERSEAFLFGDSGLRVGPEWVRQVISPLQDPAVSASSTTVLHAPNGGFVDLLRYLWFVHAAPYAAVQPSIHGPSFAMRKATFIRLEVADLWSRTISHDAPLTQLLSDRMERIHFVTRTMPVFWEPVSIGEFFATFGRWAICTRTNLFGRWLLLLAGLAIKTFIWVWALLPPISWYPLLLIVGMDVVHAFIAHQTLTHFFPKIYRNLPSASRKTLFAAPFLSVLMNWIFLINFLPSLWRNKVEWAGRTYRVHGPEKIEVLTT